MKLVTIEEMEAQRSGGGTARIIDVRLEEDFEAGHMAGAMNAPVFKVSFLEDLEALGCTTDQPVVVYGADAESHEARMAAAKLERAGFRDVQEFRAGFAAWKAAGKPSEGRGQPPVTDPMNGVFSVDLEESRVEWLGRNLFNRHQGTLRIKSGQIHLRNGQLTGGDFVLDMRSITCSDIEDSRMSSVLVEHLESDDFFDVERHPEARYQIRRVESAQGATRGLPNVRVSGDLTVKGQVNPLVLFAVTGSNAERRFCAQAALAFDRTHWGCVYGSGRFFRNVGMHLVNDLIEMQVRLVA